MTYLLNSISVNNAELKTTISIARQMSTIYNEASTYFATEEFSISPQGISGGRRISISAINGGIGHGHRRAIGLFGVSGRVNVGCRGRGYGSVDEASDCTGADAEVYTYDQCIGVELHLPDKFGMKQM